MKDVDAEVATITATAIAAKHTASVINSPGTRRKRHQAKQRRKQAKKSRKRNRT